MFLIILYLEKEIKDLYFLTDFNSNESTKLLGKMNCGLISACAELVLKSRKNRMKQRSTQSYVSFMLGNTLLCSGALYTTRMAMVTTNCGNKLTSQRLENVTPEIGNSRYYYIEPITIHNVSRILNMRFYSAVLVSTFTFN